MTEHRPGDDERSSRWLPTAVFSVFALLLVVEAVVIVLYGNYRNLIEEPGVEVSFRPASVGLGGTVPESTEWVSGFRIVAKDGTVMVDENNDRLRVRAPGELVLRFRARDAGSYLEIDYHFGEKAPGARIRLALGRIASRHGVDFICRRSLTASKKAGGTFRHNLADHAGWFELSLDVNPAAAGVGFEVGHPEFVWD